MSFLDKDNASFDALVRDQKAISALSMIMATYYIPEGTETKDRKVQIARRLVDAYKLFRPDKKVVGDIRNGAGTYGQIDKKTKQFSEELPDEEIKSSFESQYTLGLELGIWRNSNLFLSDLALRVAKMEITITEYLDIVFQNLFSYRTVTRHQEKGLYYVHFLYDTLENLNQGFSITKDQLKDLFFPTDTENDNRNALFNYLKDTSYFNKSGNQLQLSPYWQIRLEELKSSCNLEYKNKDKNETQEFFKNKDNYAKYVTSVRLTKEEEVNEGEISYQAIDRVSLPSMNGKNIIYYGAPGTGKSYGINKEIEKIYPQFDNTMSEEANFVFRTTLHPEYTYTDFVGQVMPTVNHGIIKYEFVPGIFTRALTQAIKYEKEGKAVFLILEELSRANVAAVFGDLFQLLDRKDGKSEYSITNVLIAKEVYSDDNIESSSLENRKIYIPSNLFIIGTVNTNDQNVFAMDTAFKRRFEWKYISTKPKENENNPTLKIIQPERKELLVTWHQFYQCLNKYITSEMGLGEDKQVGPYFIKFSKDIKENKNQIQNKLLQYLWDDIQGASFNGRKIFTDQITSFSELYDRFENDEVVFEDEFIYLLNSTSISDVPER